MTDKDPQEPIPVRIVKESDKPISQRSKKDMLYLLVVALLVIFFVFLYALSAHGG